ncbi:hypothetical protein NP233_g12511 [Leucocoprinus birnbaumii]|uniref:Uncharacterized protein n=1 Tax=Leucocoprinus birnbaumii TaxID=56174 RepID=A0AAD5VJY0_9AGAR|nr:hypothetical protein NP233_g12511 [Leucocoprinus birnbaumii]
MELTTKGFELILLLVRLQRTLSGSHEHFHKGWKRLQQIAPVLYVFYRDGTMFYLPVFGLSIFGFVAAFDTTITARLTCANWEAWLGIAYYICGTRLILNIRSAGIKFTTSMLTQQISTLAFKQETEHELQRPDSSCGSPEIASIVVVEPEEKQNSSAVGVDEIA